MPVFCLAAVLFVAIAVFDTVTHLYATHANLPQSFCSVLFPQAANNGWVALMARGRVWWAGADAGAAAGAAAAAAGGGDGVGGGFGGGDDREFGGPLEVCSVCQARYHFASKPSLVSEQWLLCEQHQS